MKNTNNRLLLTLGLVLLIPVIVSIFLLLFEAVLFLFNADDSNSTISNFAWAIWFKQGRMMPFYFGLTAIAGAYLIKHSRNNESNI